MGSHWLRQGDMRLDASPYAQEPFMARRLLDESGYTVRELGTLVKDVFNLPRFKRVYAEGGRAGWPYLSASEVLLLRPPMTRFLSRVMGPPNADRHFVRTGWIILTCSGSVGRVIYGTKRLEPFFLTHDLIRIVPGDEVPGGYLFAFLASWVGQALLTRGQYGAAVPHIEPLHVKPIPVPLLDEELQREIHARVQEAASLRDQANEFLDRAEDCLHEQLGLARLEPVVRSVIPDDKPRVSSIRATQISDKLRLDATFYPPELEVLGKQLAECKYPRRKLHEISERVFMPPTYKRVYVSEEYGLPILSGTQLAQVRAYGLKYISRKTFGRKLDDYVIRKGHILVTGRGTPGLAYLVPDRWDGWLTSHNILRIVTSADVHPGFLVTFLATSYGTIQMRSRLLGAVVEVLDPWDLRQIAVPVPPLEVQARIGSLATDAYEMKEQANELEEDAVAVLESSLGV